MSTTETLTLTDFLLARLDEDERAPREWQRVGGEAGSVAARRLLAEVAAKRRIVEQHRWRVAQDAHEDDYEVRLLAEARCEELDAVLRALASVYADHPDYRAEWAL